MEHRALDFKTAAGLHRENDLAFRNVCIHVLRRSVLRPSLARTMAVRLRDAVQRSILQWQQRPNCTRISSVKFQGTTAVQTAGFATRQTVACGRSQSSRNLPRKYNEPPTRRPMIAIRLFPTRTYDVANPLLVEQLHPPPPAAPIRFVSNSSARADTSQNIPATSPPPPSPSQELQSPKPPPLAREYKPSSHA